MVKRAIFLLGCWVCCSLQCSSPQNAQPPTDPDDVTLQVGRKTIEWLSELWEAQKWIEEEKNKEADAALTEQRRLWQGLVARISFVFADIIGDFWLHPENDHRLAVIEGFQEIMDYHQFFGLHGKWCPPTNATELLKRIQKYEKRRSPTTTTNEA